MREDVHRHLDGDLPAESLADEDREFVDQWERIVASFRQAAPRGSAPPWLEDRVMAEIDALPRRGPVRRLVGWLVRPAPVAVSPLAAGLAAACVALVSWLPGSGARSPEGSPTGVTSADAPQVVYVQFVLEAPAATSVAVAGDFTEWEPSFTLDDADGDGVWSGRVPIHPGVHAYMFVVDETEWRTDPNASRYQDDGFGNRNAVLAVGMSG